MIDTYLDELEAARQGQANLAANLLRYIVAGAGLSQVLNANGYKVSGAADGTSDGDYVTLRQLVAAVFSPALPGQAGKNNRFIKTDGSTAAWAWLLEWTTVNANTTAQPGQALAVRTNAASYVITLPSSPAGNTPVFLKDADYNASQHPFTVDPGAEAIEDRPAGEVMTVSTNGACPWLQYINGAWRIIR